MALFFKGTNIENIIFNGTKLDKAVYNGVTVWENWKLITSQLKVGSKESPFGTFPTSESFEYVVPSNIKPKVLKCEGWVENHTNDSNISANATAEIWGWNGSSWVQLKKSNVYQVWGHGTGTAVCSYTIPNVDNQYSKYSFRCTGNSFKRRATGYLTEYYKKGN